MPAKKKTTKVSAKAKAAVKQVVNVRVGNVPAQRRRAAAAPRPPKPENPLLKQQPSINLTLSTQSYTNPQPQPYINEYNTLLRQLADERMARAAAATPLAPNTTPLTINEQRNELLSRVEAQTPMTPIVNAFAVAAADVVKSKMADDPLTNENMFVNSGRLAENLAQKLPVSNFNYDDVDNYAEENVMEQDALVRQAEGDAVERKTPSKSAVKYENVSRGYEEYINFVRNMNERYGINETPKSRRSFNSIAGIKREVNRIQELVMNVSPRKAGKG